MRSRMKSLSKIIVLAMLTIGLCACITGKLTITDNKTGNTVTIDEGEVDVYIEAIDAGRFTIESAGENKEEGEQTNG